MNKSAFTRTAYSGYTTNLFNGTSTSYFLDYSLKRQIFLLLWLSFYFFWKVKVFLFCPKDIFLLTNLYFLTPHRKFPLQQSLRHVFQPRSISTSRSILSSSQVMLNNKHSITISRRFLRRLSALNYLSDVNRYLVHQERKVYHQRRTSEVARLIL